MENVVFMTVIIENVLNQNCLKRNILEKNSLRDPCLQGRFTFCVMPKIDLSNLFEFPSRGLSRVWNAFINEKWTTGRRKLRLLNILLIQLLHSYLNTRLIDFY